MSLYTLIRAEAARLSLPHHTPTTHTDLTVHDRAALSLNPTQFGWILHPAGTDLLLCHGDVTKARHYAGSGYTDHRTYWAENGQLVPVSPAELVTRCAELPPRFTLRAVNSPELTRIYPFATGPLWPTGTAHTLISAQYAERTEVRAALPGTALITERRALHATLDAARYSQNPRTYRAALTALMTFDAQLPQHIHRAPDLSRPLAA
ncbi:hypothetical protein [Deinococcus soli (ex Cha et al. 2016)]|uniref:Uncharacterized protein n=2 Tax=Deinococcus soli (ex Cha et al. 2016) TaxID=1309411 RepID=A0ACC6KG51_9DEIO|nr:hypothetical protein [Deinococcus soli (ex Cha et al. 2016)]MDR6218437.1 hypothetical protein [Deinococcus soli (ex Cha et al. 2016)]MDR6329177.1 hypothetical protein [Deinococcus soli (ex Cha et al. 2016)]MDR6751450.1 hypothetical protein [Deinococcus soli (ex Cha et al. 2016)]